MASGQHVFLSGPMGSGKSTVAALLGERLCMPVVDLDSAVEQKTGRSIDELFRQGERTFRRIEAETLSDVMAGAPAVVALGGGAVLDRDNRRRMLRTGTLITLIASLQTLEQRVGRGEGRPLLQGGTTEVLRGLLDERRDVYAECHAFIDTDGLDPGEVAERVLSQLELLRVAVPLGRRSYNVEIGTGLLASAGQSCEGATRVVLVTDENVERTGAVERFSQHVSAPVTCVVLPPGEQHKTLSSVDRIWTDALDAGVDRSAVVVGLGGGVVGDLAGFVASTLLRGVRLVQVPTTLLSMVDSSVGGKTGFDRVHGKNLVGTFYQPSHVFADMDLLSTLPQRERIAGLAEVAKSAWLDGEQSVAQLERDAALLVDGDPAATSRTVRMCVTLKSDVVLEDEEERSGARALLNLGHTLGHALESRAGYTDLRHGEAVALGMVLACRVAAELGSPAPQERMVSLLQSLGLPTEVSATEIREALPFVAADKKRRGDDVLFVVPAEPGQTRLERLSLQRLHAIFA